MSLSTAHQVFYMYIVGTTEKYINPNNPEQFGMYISILLMVGQLSVEGNNTIFYNVSVTGSGVGIQIKYFKHIQVMLTYSTLIQLLYTAFYKWR